MVNGNSTGHIGGGPVKSARNFCAGDGRRVFPGALTLSSSGATALQKRGSLLSGRAKMRPAREEKSYYENQ